jgi:DNA polymerase II large subunit
VGLLTWVVVEKGEMTEHTPLEEFEKRLAKKVEDGEVRCQKCGNVREFMVNEIGHVFCNRCYRKIPLISLE